MVLAKHLTIIHYLEVKNRNSFSKFYSKNINDNKENYSAFAILINLSNFIDKYCIQRFFLKESYSKFLTIFLTTHVPSIFFYNLQSHYTKIVVIIFNLIIKKVIQCQT